MLVDLALWSGLWSGSWRNLSPVHLNPFKLLGGSSRLRCFSLRGIRFPELPNLLLSSTDLVYLGNFSFRVHFTRGDIHYPLCVDQARKISHFIRIPN
jgi:hypothetical protein